MKIVLTGASGFIGGAFLRHMRGKGDPDLRIICLSSSDAGQEKLLVQWPDLEVYALRSLDEPRTAKAIGNADAFIHCGILANGTLRSEMGIVPLIGLEQGLQRLWHSLLAGRRNRER